MNDWDRLINERFAGKNDTLKMLSETIDEVLSELTDLRTPINEDADSGQKRKKFTITLPTIRLSEKEWGKEGTKDREIITNLLSRIIGSGSTISEKINLLNDYLTQPVREDATTADVMTTIVFLDTLTNIMIHFNAAAAGFTFEGFLAAMLEGEQVPAGTSGIQDIIDNEKNPLSLKLLTEVTTPYVHGSYYDLISHFTDPSKLSPYIVDPETGKEIENPDYLGQAGVGGSMKYLIALKSWRESDANKMGELAGTISFYEFVFSARTFLESLFSYQKNKKLLLLPANLGLDGAGSDEQTDFYDPLGYKNDGEIYNNLTTSRQKQFYRDLVDNMTAEAGKDFWENTFEVVKNSNSPGKYHIVSRETGEVIAPTTKARGTSFPGLPTKKQRGADPRFRKSAEYAGKDTLSYGQSVKLLQTALADSDQKFWDLIKETSGMGSGEETQFVISPNYWKKDYEDGVGYLGQIKIGRAAIRDLADKYAEKLDQRIFDIFEMLEKLSAELNGYFVGGNKEDGLAAASTANEIESGTREYQTEKETT